MILMLLALQLALSTSSAHADDVVFAQVDNPCTDKESIEFGPAVPKAWQDRLTSASKEHESSFLILASAQVLKTSSKDQAFQSLADYQAGRALYQLGLPHLAFERFNTVLAYTSPHARNLKIAALKCIARIQNQVPSLVLLPQSVQAMACTGIPMATDAEKAVISTVLVSYIEKQISGVAAPDLATAMRLLQGTGPFEAYILSLQSAKADNAPDTIAKAEKFLAYDQQGEGLPEFLKGRADTTRMLLGQLYYESGKYTDADRIFRAVTNDSNYMAQALTDLAWSNLLEKHYNEALGAARNLLMGVLKRTFSPEADVVTAIALVETCHFTETLESIKHFNKGYWSAYNWLYQWRKNYPANADLYHTLVKQMKKKEKVPVCVTTEWTRSPVFIQSQEELNVVYDERDAIKVLAPKLAAYQKAHRRLQLTPFIDRMYKETRDGEAREKTLIATINADLVRRSANMLTAIADAWDNSQLIEVETYNKAGDKIMADNFAAKGREIAKNRGKHKEDTAPVWDWGRVPAADDDSAEVWEDEVGFLQADLKDQCMGPRK